MRFRGSERCPGDFYALPQSKPDKSEVKYAKGRVKLPSVDAVSAYADG